MIEIVYPGRDSPKTGLPEMSAILEGRSWQFLKREEIEQETSSLHLGLYIAPNLKSNNFGFSLVEVIRERPVHVRDMPDVPENIKWSSQFPWLVILNN